MLWRLLYIILVRWSLGVVRARLLADVSSDIFLCLPILLPHALYEVGNKLLMLLSGDLNTPLSCCQHY